MKIHLQYSFVLFQARTHNNDMTSSEQHLTYGKNYHEMYKVSYHSCHLWPRACVIMSTTPPSPGFKSKNVEV